MKNTGLFWWIDRWRKSSAYMDMTLEEQGAYRNLLDEAHLRGGPLPNDERVLAKACGDALAWSRVQTVVMARFELRRDGWHNETLDEVYSRSVELSSERAEAGRLGGLRSGESRREAKASASQLASSKIEANDEAKKKQNSKLLSMTDEANGEAKGQAKTKSPSPSPSPDLSQSPVPSPVPDTKISVVRAAVSVSKGNGKGGGSARSNRPIFRGQRFVVFDWMLDDISQMLGPSFEAFGLDEFFDRLDKIAARQNVVLPKPQVWPWIQSRVIAEAASRGLPVVSQAPKPHKLDVRDAEALKLMRSLA